MVGTVVPTQPGVYLSSVTEIIYGRNSFLTASARTPPRFSGRLLTAISRLRLRAPTARMSSLFLPPSLSPGRRRRTCCVAPKNAKRLRESVAEIEAEIARRKR